jgi:putative FmdB family regulatory protein
MPLYEYKCKKCQKVIEVFRKASETSPLKCDCGNTLQKVFHPAGIILKGPGFYKTDYAPTKPKSTEEAGSKEKVSSSTGEEAS